MPATRVGRGIAAQVGLARRESPARAQRYLGWSKILVTRAARHPGGLAAGEITEWRAQIVARETAWLSALHRRVVDEEVAPHLESWGDRQVEAEVKKRAYRLDPHGYLARLSNKARRPDRDAAPGTGPMSDLTGLLPVAQGVARPRLVAAGGRQPAVPGRRPARGQIMADTLVERVTGQATAEAVPVGSTW